MSNYNRYNNYNKRKNVDDTDSKFIAKIKAAIFENNRNSFHKVSIKDNVPIVK